MLSSFFCNSKHWSEIAQFFAYVAACIYFSWKWISGYLVSNLTIEPVLTRQLKSEAIDYLRINLKLIKGDRESVVLTGIAIDVTDGEKKIETINLTSPAIPDKGRMMRLAPGENTEFATLIEISSINICYIEIYLTGYAGFFNGKLKRRAGHWKASVYSLPIPPNENKVDDL